MKQMGTAQVFKRNATNRLNRVTKVRSGMMYSLFTFNINVNKEIAHSLMGDRFIQFIVY